MSKETAKDEAPRRSDAIALISKQESSFGDLQRLLKLAADKVDHAETLSAIPDYKPYTLIAVQYDSLSEQEQAELANDFRARTSPPTLLLLTDRFAQRDLAHLFGKHVLTNMFVVTEDGSDISDLLVTVQKVRYGEIFGMEKYFVWGVEPRSLATTVSSERAAIIDVICEYARTIGVVPRLRNAIRTVADEFLTNAFYNAPVLPDGSARFPAMSRRSTVRLGDDEEIRIQYCCDGRRFGLSVTDPFGSLDPTSVQDYLARAMRGGADQLVYDSGGAGLGFYEIFSSLSHFVVNIEPRVRTEMIGLLEVGGSFKTFATAGRSFNLFVKESRR